MESLFFLKSDTSLVLSDMGANTACLSNLAPGSGKTDVHINVLGGYDANGRGIIKKITGIIKHLLCSRFSGKVGFIPEEIKRERRM